MTRISRSSPQAISITSAWNAAKLCKTYIKSIDLTKNGRAEPLVDELASAPLDLWAREHGYAKLQNNLLGI